MRINRVITCHLDGSNNPVAQQIANYPTLASRVIIQMVTGGTGIGYVMDGVATGHTPLTTVDDDVTAELYPASASGPGGVYTDTASVDGPCGIDLNRLWVAASVEGDKIRVSADLKV